MGPSGRRARWYQKLSQFRLSVQYIKGKDNVVADALSRWAYPASQAGGDVSMHGTLQDAEEKEDILAEEKREERDCKKVTINMVEGEYQQRFKMMEREFGLEEERRVEQEMKVIAPIGGRTSESSGGEEQPLEEEELRFQFASRPGEGSSKDFQRGRSKAQRSAEPGVGTPEVQPGADEPRGPPQEARFQFKRPSVNVMDEDWDGRYAESVWWKDWWERTKGDRNVRWPEGVRLWRGKMYYKERLCVPEGVSGKVVRSLHALVGHVGGEKLKTELDRRYTFAPSVRLMELIREVNRGCVVCQAHAYPNFQVHGPMEATPVCPELGVSLSVDLFKMPEVESRTGKFDCMLLCVDRMSGWMMVTPHLMKGLTAEIAARDMVERWWQPFGVPSVVTSDQGPQFAGAFWRTLCGLLGVRTAYAQAYHHQANGRAEVAGKTFKMWLRKIAEENRGDWVELIPHVLRKYHDMPGVNGLYEIVYGRYRPLAGLPYQAPRVSEDAVEYFDRMRQLDHNVAKHLDAIHQKQVDWKNRNRHHKPEYVVGERVWFRRPMDLAAGLQSGWEGPCEIVRREGASSYVVKRVGDVEQLVNEDQMKKFVEDRYSGSAVELNYWRGGQCERVTIP